MKTCCVIGHRVIPQDKLEFVRRELRREILLAVEEGFTDFYSGFGDGTDLIFAEIAQEIKKENQNIKLIALVAYANRMKMRDKRVEGLLAGCDAVKVYEEKYRTGCYFRRNRWMLQRIERVIAVYNGGEKSNTLSAMRYAHAIGRDIRVIQI